MKVKKLLAGFLSAAMVLGTMSFPAFAEEVDSGVIVAQIGERKYTTISAAVDDIKANEEELGNEITILSDISLNDLQPISRLESVILTGDGHQIVDFANKTQAIDAKITFKNLIINEDNGNYNGIQHCPQQLFENCVINGQYWAYALDTEFKGCTFNQTNSDAYNIWTYVANDIRFNQCVFNSAGKSVLIYDEGGSHTQNSAFDRCTFNASVPVAGKAAIEIDSSLVSGYSVNIRECNANGFDNGTVSGNKLWNNKKGNKTTVVVDDTTVYSPEMIVAKIGNINFFTDLTQAIKTAKDGDTIDLLGNTVVLDGTQNTIDKNITITNGTIDITDADCQASGIFYVTASDAKFKNVDFTGNGYSSAFGVIYVNEDGKVTLNNCDMNLANEQFAGAAPVRGNGVANNIKVVGGTWNLENTSSVIKQATVDIDGLTVNAAITDPTLEVGQLCNHGFRQIAGTIKNSNITANGFETAMKNDVGELTLDNTTFESDKTVIVRDGAKLLGVNGSAVRANFEVKANSVVNSIKLTGDVTAADTADLRYNYFENGVPSNGVIYPCFEDEAMTKLVFGSASATDAEMKDVIEETVSNVDLNKETADNLAETVKEMSSDVQKKITPAVVEEIINAQGTVTNTETSAAFSMDNAISATVEEKDDTADVNVVLTSGNNKVYNITATENNAVVNETSTPVLIKIKTDATITKVLHEHNGVVKELPFTQANGYVMFTMNEFSNVALVSAIPVSDGQAKLSFVPTTSDEGNAKYKLVLTGDTFDTVKNFVSGEFVTSLVGTGSTPFEYVITPENGEIDVYYDTNPDGTRKYHVNLDHFNVDTSYTTKQNSAYPDSVVIGTMTVEGYGAGSIVVSDIQMNKHDGSNENLAKDINTIAGDPAIFNIAVPTRDLKINVNFPNNVNNNAKAYQNMKVEISGGDLAAPITKELGNNVQGVVWNNNTYSVTEKLTYDRSYTVTVSGEGYRTARYTVTMTDNKTLNFWNNVKKQAEVVEVGSDPLKAKNVTFLAGELVRDNQINIYDLSAVVSYFGRTNDVSTASQYAKYDLNRDGKVDSKDVAYVLVSWGK